MADELWIWRPIIAGKITLTEVKDGTATIEDIRALNAILDMQADMEAAQYEKVKA